MRRAAPLLIALTTALGLAGTAGPGLAQDQSTPGIRPGHVPGEGLSEPASGNASNISPYDTRSTIAPRLPTPEAGDDGNPHRFLVSARMALSAGRTGEAQEALERAETRLLDRSTPAFRTGDPSTNPVVEQIRTILAALSVNDRGRAFHLLDAAIAETGGRGRPPR
jgi:hypothetical protein